MPVAIIIRRDLNYKNTIKCFITWDQKLGRIKQAEIKVQNSRPKNKVLKIAKNFRFAKFFWRFQHSIYQITILSR
jgi:hypothetical protein